MSIDAVKSHSSADAEPGSPAPRRWWQWFLVYPAVAVALVSAIPTYVELFNSSKFDVPFGQSSLAKQQNDLWERNLTCSAAPLDPFVNEYNVEVDAIICRSGDVLVRVRTPNKKTFYRWVPVDAFPIRSASLSVVAEAHAAQASALHLAQSTPGGAGRIAVVCQRLDKGRLIRILRPAGAQPNACVREIVNSYTGEVVQRERTSCDSKC